MNGHEKKRTDFKNKQGEESANQVVKTQRIGRKE